MGLTPSSEVPADVALNQEHFRHVLGQYPTGVVVVTATGADGEPLGMTVGSFASVSMDPPLVSFMPSRTSSSWATLRPVPRFCVNVLGAHQGEVCRLIASRKQDKFDGIEWHLSARGNPVLTGCVATVECTVEQIVDGGDHEIVIGRVQELSVENATLPLLFFRGGYGSFRPGTMLSGDSDLVDHVRQVHLVRGRLEALARDLDAEVTTVVLVGDEVVVTSSYGAASTGELGSRVGYRAPFVPPLGSVHAAWGGPELEQRWLDNLGTDATTEEREHYRAVLDAVRERGFATSVTSEDLMDSLALGMSHGRRTPSMSVLRSHLRTVADEFDPTRTVGEGADRLRGVMAPVFGPSGDVAFQVMVWGDAQLRVDAAGLEQRASVLRDAAAGITQALASS